MRSRGRDVAMEVAIVLACAVLVTFVGVVWRASHDLKPAEPSTCTRVYDLRGGSGSITITWDDPRACGFVTKGSNPR